MKHSYYEGLRSLVLLDKKHIKNFLKVHNIPIKHNKVSLRFFQGETIELNSKNYQQFIDSNKFLNLWEIDEPHLVLIKFTIDGQLKENTNQFIGVMVNLLNKICSRSWPDNPDCPQEYLEVCNNICIHHRFINYNPTNNKVILIGGICLCS
jgi:hypothetical protein